MMQHRQHQKPDSSFYGRHPLKTQLTWKFPPNIAFDKIDTVLELCLALYNFKSITRYYKTTA
jgi:hypothetical protein